METQLSRPTESINPTFGMPAGAVPSQRHYLWLPLLVAGPLALLILKWNPALNQTILHDPLIHVLITLVASLLGVILALLVLHVARRAQDGRVFLIGMGFLSAAGIFITHSISTPNVLMSGRGLATGISGLISLVVGGAFFAFSGLKLGPQFNRWLMRHTRLWLLLFLAFWLTYNWALLITIPALSAAQIANLPMLAAHDASATSSTGPDRSDAPTAVQHEQIQLAATTSSSMLDLLRGALVILGLGCYVFAVRRHYTFYRQSHSQVGVGLICGMVLFGEALLSQYFSQVYTQRQELEQLNQSLRLLEAHKDQLTQMIVHDLKNPLTALLGFLEILRLDHLTIDQSGLLQNAMRSGRNLSDLINDLLDIRRIEEGRLELDLVQIAPCDLLTECANEMHGWIAQEYKTLTVEIPADLPPLHADYRLMRRVILNLLSNAIKHTPAGTHICLHAAPHLLLSDPGSDPASAPVSQILIEIEDNGPGIPPAYLERIFEKFGRFSTEYPVLQSSTGLGLTFCRLVVEAHGGTIGVTSVLGQQTIFRLTMPCSVAG